MAEVKKLTFKYVFDKDSYNPNYANGVYGGLGSNDEIVMHFYHERPPIPNKTEVEFGENIAPKTTNSPEVPPVIRFVVSGITMNLNAAEQFHSWLGNVIEKSKKRNGK